MTLDDIPGGGTRMTKNARGIPWVLVNGEPVIEDGAPTDVIPGAGRGQEQPLKKQGTDMNVDDMIILSIDDHTIEPPDLFERHVPAKYKDQAPRLVRDEQRLRAAGCSRAEVVGIVGLNATVSWPKEEWGLDPSALAEMRPGAYLIDERVRDMNRNGVLASMCFPSMPGFSGRRFQEAKDTDLALVMLKAYNDWHIDEWCGAHPGRFIPLAIGPDWDMDAMVAEVKRVAAMGFRAISHAGAAVPPGAAQLPERLLGSVLPRRERRGRRHVPPHRYGPRRDQHGPRLLTGQLHGARHTGHRALRAGPPLGSGPAEVSRT